jgi:hypothetical protein
MQDLYEYIAAFLPNLWPLVTVGSLFGLDAAASSYWPQAKRLLDRMPQDRRRNLEILALFLAVLYAGFATWNPERKARDQEHEARAKAEQQASMPRDGQQIIDRLSGDLIAARAQIDALKKERDAERQERHLSDADKDDLLRVFKPLVSALPELRISASEGEPQEYAREFMNFFNDVIGIKVARVGLLFRTSARSAPIQVVVKDPTHPPAKAVLFLQSLSNAGFHVQSGILETLGDDEFILVFSKA